MTCKSKNTPFIVSVATLGLSVWLGLGLNLAQAGPVLPDNSRVLSPMMRTVARPHDGLQVHNQGPRAATRILNLARGRSAVIELPTEASDVFVANPKVADAVLRTPRRIFILGVETGATDAMFYDRMGNQILNINIHVAAATDDLSEAIRAHFPKAQVEVQAANDHLLLSGTVPNATQSDQIAQLAAAWVDDPKKVLNFMSITGKDQVTLKVRVVEVNRNTIKQLGFNTAAVLGQTGGVQYLLNNTSTYGVNNKLLGGTSSSYKMDTTMQPELSIPCSDPSLSNCYKVIKGPADMSNWNTATARQTVGSKGLNQITSTLEAFERVGLVRTLAEPNLTAVSGESAKFLAGGEFPIPVSQDSQGRITVEFKPFGVGLGFTPVVLSEGRISMRITGEVSELSSTGALQLSNSLTIPGLEVRRVETSVEMASGQSMMIAGLMQSKYKQMIGSLPGMTSLPVLGTLFRSRDYLNDETEMVVIVTPYIVSPTDPDALQTPADNLEIAHDSATIFLGQLNRVIHAKGGNVQSSAAPYQAPVGYVIE